jgi:3-oxoacyl-[acyl-carrier-protein] synthase III
MRPKKRVLVYCLDELKLSIMSCVLGECGIGTGQYLLIDQAASAAGMLKALQEAVQTGEVGFYSCVLMIEAAECQIQRVRDYLPGVPILLIADGTPESCATVVLAPATPVADVIERLRILCARKRGPKKHPVTFPESGNAEMAAA